MKHLLGISLLAVAALCSCSNNEKKSEASQRHDAWVASLNDSLQAARDAINQNTLTMQSLDSTVNTLISGFEQTSNPKLVEQYVVAKGYANYDTSSRTGLIARITESGAFELVATLKSGSFDRIAVSSNGESRESDVVAYDKALNSRIGGTSIVAFKGAKADSIGELIHLNSSGDIVVAFKGGKGGAAKLDKQQKSMIARTWEYYNTMREIDRLQRQSLLLNEKCKIIETRINQDL